MTEILLSYFKSGKFLYDTIINSICTELEDLLTKKNKTVKNIKTNNNYKKLIKDTFLFSAEYKIEALKEIIQKLSLFDFTDDYKKEVNTLRNKFAHAVLEIDESGRQFFKSGEGDIIFDESLCKTIRKNINKHKKSIDELEKEINNIIDK